MSKEEKQRKECKVLFLINILFVIPLFIILAVIDSIQNHVIYSWPFIFVFLFGLGYGLFAIKLDSIGIKHNNCVFYYIGLYFLLIFFLGTYGFNREYALGSQITIGLILGLIIGFAVVSLYKWKWEKEKMKI